jgi:alanyl-tRNA synthetase
MPDRVTVRHVGLLGAAQPAVPGLKSVSFAEGEHALEIEFASQADADPLNKRRQDMKTVEQLQAELAAEQQKTADLTKENNQLKIDLAAANDKAKTAETNLAAFQGAQRKKSIEDRIDKLIADGKLMPAAKPEKLMVALSLANDAEEIELAAGQGKKSKLEIYLAGLEDSPKLGLVGHEFTTPGNDKDQDAKQVDLTKHV